MKLLQVLRDSEIGIPKDGRIKAHLRKFLEKRGPPKFSNIMLNWFGGRGFNVFLDYGLLALKMHHLFKSKYDLYDKGHKEVHRIVDLLLFDDRHDMYQNVPYILEELDKKLSDDTREIMWQGIANAIIESFNVKGTEDVAHTFRIEED